MANFLYDLGFLGTSLYGYATASSKNILDNLEFWQTHNVITKTLLKVNVF